MAHEAEPAAQAQVLAVGHPADSTTAFGRLAAQLTAARADGSEESESVEEQALEILDHVALDGLNAAVENGDAPTARIPDLDAVNRRLASFVTHQPPIGESYRVLRLGGSPASYALVANFGLSGPSAVRLYARANGMFGLAAQIDRYAQKDFLDDYMELVPLAPSSGAGVNTGALFVTVAGRTDDLQTGVFTAWRFDGQRVMPVWASDILQQSSYEAAGDGFRLTYCADADDAGACHRMQRDRYVWRDGAWTRAETTPVPVSAPGK